MTLFKYTLYIGLFFSLSCFANLIDAVKTRNPTTVSEILEAPNSSLEDTENSLTALEYAVRGGHTEIVSLLINAGADFWRWRFFEAEMPIQIAVQYGHTEIIKLLILAGIDPNFRFRGGYTLLHIAALYGRVDSFETLVMLGANTGARDDMGRDIFCDARFRQTPEILSSMQAIAARSLF